MQVLDYTNAKSISTWSDDSGSYIRGFLISTKPTKNKWRVTKNTIHQRAQTAVSRDFAVIPNRIGNKALLDGHVVGSREEVLKAYSDNSYGKITQVLGPFSYNDGTDDVWYDHITKLHNDRVASSLMAHGSGTLVPFATSPHIFALQGDDINGWYDYDFAGVCLVSNPAYGEQSIITKTCKGEQTKCTNALSQSQENRIAAVLDAITSLVTSSTSDSHTNMSSSKDTIQVAEDLNKSAVNLSDNSLQVQETKTTATPEQSTTAKTITDQDIITKPVSQDTNEEVKILRQKIADMENEKKNELLNGMFELYKDEKERDSLIKEISKSNDLSTIKYLKHWIDILAPLYQKKGNDEATRLFKEEKDRELQSMKKNKIASSTGSYKFQLPGEPKDPEKTEDKIASSSTSKVGEMAEFISLIRGGLKK